MLGNDVVDFGDAESRAAGLHPRFDRRVFDPVERAWIAASPHGEHVRWLIWAAKESAYKAARKQDPRTVFAPVRFAVRRAGVSRATVVAGTRRFDVDLVMNARHVHAVARGTADSPGPLCTAVAPLPAGATPSDAVRQLVVATLAPILGVTCDALSIRRHGRIPELWLHGRRSAADLSLSHHGRFVAFACVLPAQRLSIDWLEHRTQISEHRQNRMISDQRSVIAVPGSVLPPVFRQSLHWRAL
jgi:phosphopantetheinyl transferase (holo-ACP synthase)